MPTPGSTTVPKPARVPRQWLPPFCITSLVSHLQGKFKKLSANSWRIHLTYILDLKKEENWSARQQKGRERKGGGCSWLAKNQKTQSERWSLSALEIQSGGLCVYLCVSCNFSILIGPKSNIRPNLLRMPIHSLLLRHKPKGGFRSGKRQDLGDTAPPTCLRSRSSI